MSPYMLTRLIVRKLSSDIGIHRQIAEVLGPAFGAPKGQRLLMHRLRTWRSPPPTTVNTTTTAQDETGKLINGKALYVKTRRNPWLDPYSRAEIDKQQEDSRSKVAGSRKSHLGHKCLLWILPDYESILLMRHHRPFWQIRWILRLKQCKSKKTKQKKKH